MSAILKIALSTSNPQFLTNLVNRNISMFAVTFVPQQKKIALIFGPQRDQDCSHIWTPLKLTLQPYLDPNMTDVAIIREPPIVQW